MIQCAVQVDALHLEVLFHAVKRFAKQIFRLSDICDQLCFRQTSRNDRRRSQIRCLHNIRLISVLIAVFTFVDLTKVCDLKDLRRDNAEPCGDFRISVCPQTM